MSFTPNVSSSNQAEAIKVKFIKALENYNQNFPEEIQPEVYQALRDLFDIIDFEKVLNSDNINKSLYQQYHGVDGYKDEALLYSEEEVENGGSEAVGYKIDSLFLLAVGLNDAELVQDMLNSGAKVDIHNKLGGWTVLHYAADIGNTEVVKLLIDAGSRSGFDIDLKDDGDTPLHLAAQEGHTDVVQILLKSGANPNVQDCNGCTPLHSAFHAGHTDVVQILLNSGANPNAQDCYGCTPLHSAFHAGHTDVVQILLKSGANPNIQDCDGDTPLHLAVFWGHKDAAVMLIENGADVNIKNNYGTTALDLIRDRGYAEIEEYLANPHTIPEEMTQDGTHDEVVFFGQVAEGE